MPTGAVNVLTTTLCYPTPAHPDQGVFVQRRAAALAERGDVRVTVVSPQPWCPLLRRYEPVAGQQHPLPATFPKLISVPPLNWATDGVAFAWAIEKVVRSRAGRSAIHLIDAHFVYPDGVGAWRAGRKLGVPVVVTVRGKIVSLSRRAVRRMQIAAMLRGVDARIAVSESLAGWVRRIGGTDLSVDVIPNGVDAATFRMKHRHATREQLGWDPKTRYILAVGHLQRLKGFDRLLKVMPAVRNALGDVRLVLAGSRRGERSYRRDVSELIEQCNASADDAPVQLTGAVPAETLNLMYNAADVVVNASRSEGWSNATTEALAVGTPVVATNVGGNREQLCSSELGILVPDGDGEALAGAIITALSREWNRPLISAHGSARTWSHVAEEVHDVFRRVLAARAAGATPRPVLPRKLAAHLAEVAR